MINDLWSCTDKSEQLLDQKCYMFVSNFTDSANVWDSFKLLIAFSLWEEDHQAPNNTPKNSCLTHYLTANWKRKVASISSCFLGFGLQWSMNS